MKKLVVIYGGSASGKSTIKKLIVKKRPQYHEVITCTTRPMRENEQQGVDYNFISEQEMAQKIYNGEMVECVPFKDWLYGTEFAAIRDDKINIGVWNPEGVEILNEEPTLDCLNFYILSPAKQRLLRSLNREENPNVDEIVRRYLADKKDFERMEIGTHNTIVINNNGSSSLDELAELIIQHIEHYFGQE